jgi:large conductance mechanosensitive channel
MLKEFKEFVFKGNMLDMAIGIIMGAAFGGTVKSLVDNIMTPIVSGVFRVPDFKELYLPLDGKQYPTLADLAKAGAPAIKYGVFMNDILNLLIVGFSMFVMMKYLVGAMKKKDAAPATPPAPPKEEVLLGEIRDLLRSRTAV